MHAIDGSIDAGSIAHRIKLRKNLEILKNSEFENKGLLGNTRMMIQGNSEIKKVFPADVASSLWESQYCLKSKQYSVRKQEFSSTRTLYFVWDNVRSRGCSKKVD